MLKKILSILLIMMMVLPVGKISFILAEEEEEVSDYDKCVKYKDKAACAAIAQSNQDSIKQLEDQIAQAENDRDAAKALAVEYAGKAEALQDEINSLAIQIEQLKVKIQELEIQIAENEAKVEALNTRVKNRMVESQKSMHFSGYLEFVLGSKSFSDMLSRIYGVEAIVSKDKADRDELLDIIRQLNADKAELDASKALLDESYETIVARQAELLIMQEFYEEEERRIDEELDAMTAERDQIYESFEELRSILASIGVTVNTGFTAAVHDSWITEGVWNYDSNFLSGTWHLGIDYAARRGEEIHAPAGGMIIRADGSCYDPGDLGSYCGAWIAGGGNQIYLMAEVDGRVYGFIFFHLNAVYVSRGDYVYQDEVIGTVGSSGKSTGPHCHIEMYYLGRGNLEDYLAMNWNVTFSCGRGSTAYYYHRCEAGNSAPCILNPALYLP